MAPETYMNVRRVREGRWTTMYGAVRTVDGRQILLEVIHPDLGAIPGLRVHVADGAAFVQRAPADSWDVVVVDAFDSSERTSAWADPRWFAALRRVLCSGGAVAINVIGTLDGVGPVPDIVRAAQGGFERLRVLPVMLGDEEYHPSALRNVVIVASRRG